MMSPTTNRVWPTREEYKLAMLEYKENIQDSRLRQGELIIERSRPLNFSNSELYTCLFLIGQTMIRCFCRSDQYDPPRSIFERYRSLERFFAQKKEEVSALVPVKYVHKGIQVDFFDERTLAHVKTDIMPFVTMDYVAGQQLGTFIAENYKTPSQMNMLCAAWLRMIREMEAVRMAHGDLDLSNVIVQYDPSKQSILLKLVDYDNSWIPEFEKDFPFLPEFGHKPFQHPEFFDKTTTIFNQEIDRFASLVIYISLKALALRSDLYTTYGADDHHLLFSHEDYENVPKGIPGNVEQLKALQLEGLDEYFEELRNSLREKRMPASLDAIASRQRNRPPVIVQPQQPLQVPVQNSPAQSEDLLNAVILPDGFRERINADWNNIRSRRESPLPPRTTLPPTFIPSSPQQPQQLQTPEQPAAFRQQLDEPSTDQWQEQMPMPGQLLSPQEGNWHPPVPKADRGNRQRARPQTQQTSYARDASQQQPASVPSSRYSEPVGPSQADNRFQPGNFNGYSEPTEPAILPFQSNQASRKVSTESAADDSYYKKAGIDFVSKVIMAIIAIMLIVLFIYLVLSHLGPHSLIPHEYQSALTHLPSLSRLPIHPVSATCTTEKELIV